ADFGTGIKRRSAEQTRARNHHPGARRGPGSTRAERGGAARAMKGMIQPRPAVLAMAPYHPPTAGRAGKLRLDFNENTVGCSPRVIEAITRQIAPPDLAVYPEYGGAKDDIARYFGVSPDQFVFTNGTDEAIQVFINTYVDDGQEVLVLKPA